MKANIFRKSSKQGTEQQCGWRSDILTCQFFKGQRIFRTLVYLKTLDTYTDKILTYKLDTNNYSGRQKYMFY